LWGAILLADLASDDTVFDNYVLARISLVQFAENSRDSL